jgi:transcription initiation factor TFIID subunit 12
LQAFRLQPELQQELTKLTEAFVSDAVDFGCALAARRRGATLRPSDLAMYMQRNHHIYVPGFNKEYRQYKRPVASELHKARTVLVRKAQLHPQQQAAATAGEGGGGGKAGGVRFSGAE